MDKLESVMADAAVRSRTEARADRIATQTAAANNSQNTLLHIDVVCAMTAMSRGTIYKRIREGDFPSPVRFGTRCSRWHAKAVSDWIGVQVSK